MENEKKKLGRKVAWNELDTVLLKWEKYEIVDICSLLWLPQKRPDLAGNPVFPHDQG